MQVQSNKQTFIIKGVKHENLCSAICHSPFELGTGKLSIFILIFISHSLKKENIEITENKMESKQGKEKKSLWHKVHSVIIWPFAYTNACIDIRFSVGEKFTNVKIYALIKISKIMILQ